MFKKNDSGIFRISVLCTLDCQNGPKNWYWTKIYIYINYKKN